jgi:hypothetical protein
MLDRKLYAEGNVCPEGCLVEGDCNHRGSTDPHPPHTACPQATACAL